MKLTPLLKSNDVRNINRAIQSLNNELGPHAVPIFSGLILTGLTEGRVVYVGAGGRLTDYSGFTFASSIYGGSPTGSKTLSIQALTERAELELSSGAPAGENVTIGSFVFTVPFNPIGKDVVQFTAETEGVSGGRYGGRFIIYSRIPGNGIAERFRVNSVGNVGFGTSSFGADATKVLAIGTGTAPSSSPADIFQMYSSDFVAGNACPTFRTENGTVIVLNQDLKTTATPTFATVTATSFVIGTNTLNGTEWAFLDGQNQSVFTTSSPTFESPYFTGTLGVGVSPLSTIVGYFNKTMSASICYGLYGGIQNNRNSSGTETGGLYFIGSWRPINLTSNATYSRIFGSWSVGYVLAPTVSPVEDKTLTVTNLDGAVGEIWIDKATSSATTTATMGCLFRAIQPTVSNGATITDLYGLYVPALTVGVANWGLGINTQSYINAGLSIGKVTTPVYPLDVVGDINTTTLYRVNGVAGVSGNFTTVDLKTVTVTYGIITSIV